jgi:hypothetical protein
MRSLSWASVSVPARSAIVCSGLMTGKPWCTRRLGASSRRRKVVSLLVTEAQGAELVGGPSPPAGLGAGRAAQ